MNVVCPVHKGFSTYCDHLTLLSAVQIHYLEPTSLAVWFGKHLCLCVCMSIYTTLPWRIFCICVYTYIYVYITAVWGGKKQANLEMTLHLFPCIHTKCPWCLFCAIRIMPCSTWIPFRSWFLLSAKNVWLVNCWMYDVPVVLEAQNYCFPPSIVVWATCFKIRHF